MTKSEIARIHLVSSNNREAIQAATYASCYFCLQVNPVQKITDWTDGGNTALCPNCEIDAVLPGEVPMADLEALNMHWFCRQAKI